jgi:benzodiazapine receptor
MKARQWVALAVFVGGSFAAGAVGQWVGGAGAGPWYRSLAKPPFNPPSWLFAPVWSALYLMMGVAAWLVWRRRGLLRAAPAMVLFVAQLALNALWPILFFGMHRPDVAFAEILILWAAILATTVAFFRVTAAAGWMMVPYLAWVTFAAVLNAALWRMNLPGA